MTVLVMGATGNVGAEVVQALLDHGQQVAAVSRSGRAWPEGVTGVVADPNQAGSLDEAAERCDAAYVMCGYAAEAGLLASLPAEARVAVLSSSSAPLGEHGNAMGAYHLRTEQAVQASGHPWTVVRSCSMQSNLLRWRDQLASGDVVTAPFGDVAPAMVDPADIAAVLALALATGDHDGRTYRVSGPEPVAPPEQLALLGSRLGRALRFEPLDDEAARAEMGTYADATFEIFRERPELETEVQPTIGEVLGRRPSSLEAWVERNAGRFG